MKKKQIILMSTLIPAGVSIVPCLSMTACSCNSKSDTDHFVEPTTKQKEPTIEAGATEATYKFELKEATKASDLTITIEGQTKENNTELVKYVSHECSGKELDIKVNWIGETTEDSTCKFNFKIVSNSGWTNTIRDCKFKFTKGEKTLQEIIDSVNAVLATTPCNTMTAALGAVKVTYDIEAATIETAGWEYVWDQAANKFAVIDADGNFVVTSTGHTPSTNKWEIWKMVKAPSTFLLKSSTNEVTGEFDPNSIYSQYLRKNETFPNTLSFCSGIDTGSNTNLVLQLVENSAIQSPTTPVTIATNGCSLKVTSTSFTNIEHTGSLLDLEVKQLVTNGSFSTEGKIVGDVVIDAGVNGSFVAESTAVVNTIFVADAQTKVQVNSNSVGTVVPSTSTAAQAIDSIVTVAQTVTSQPTVEHTEQTVPASTELSGLGTERSPYIVTSKADFVKMHEYTSKGYKHYIFENTNKVIDGSDWETNSYWGDLYGTFDGNGLVINNLSKSLFNVVGAKNSLTTEVMKISNITLNCNIAVPFAVAGVVRSLDRNAIFENVNVHGSISGSEHVGGYVCYGPGNIHWGTENYPTVNWQFKNCCSDAMISATACDYAAAFVAHRFSNDDSVYTFEDSIFNGVINTNEPVPAAKVPHQKLAYFVTGPKEYCVKIKTKYSQTFKEKYGNPEGNNYIVPNSLITEGGYRCFYTGIDENINDAPAEYDQKKPYYVRSGYIASGKRNQITLVTQSISGQQVGTLQVEKQQGTEFAYAALFIGPDGVNPEHKNLVTSFLDEKPTEETSGQTTILKTNIVKNYNVYVNDPSHQTPGIQGDDYVIYDTTKYVQTTNPTKYILIIQYKSDSSGRLIPFYTTKFTW